MRHKHLLIAVWLGVLVSADASMSAAAMARPASKGPERDKTQATAVAHGDGERKPQGKTVNGGEVDDIDLGDGDDADDNDDAKPGKRDGKGLGKELAGKSSDKGHSAKAPKGKDSAGKGKDDVIALEGGEAGEKKGDRGPKIDLAKGPFILQIEKNKMPKKAFEPDANEFKPYLAAQLGAPTAFTLAHDTEPLVYAPKIEAECQAIVDNLLKHWRGPKPETVPVRIAARAGYGAHANTAGVIVVYLGTFIDANGALKVANRDELAVLLAHELAHLLLLHPRDTGILSVLTKGMKLGAGIYSNYALFKDATFSNNQLKVNPDADELIRTIGADAASSSLMLDILLPGRNRKREIEADQLGIDLAWRSGYPLDEDVVTHFAERNMEDDHAVSERMDQMRGVMILLLTQLIAKQTNSLGSKAGGFGSLLGMVGVMGANTVATKIFEKLASNRKNHLDPEVRGKLLAGYYNANVKNQTDFDQATAPRPANRPKLARWHPDLAPAVAAEAKGLFRPMAMAVEYEKFAFDAMGTALEDDEDRMEEERKTGGGIMGKLRTAIGKAAKDNPAKADTESVAAAMKDGKAAVNPVAAKNALVASPETKQREQDLLKRAQSLAVRMGQAGAVNPMLASSSHGAGRLSSIVLRQEPRGQLFWSDGQRRGYPLAKLYRAYGSSLARSKAGAKLPVLVADYRTKVGTIDPILDVAVGAEMAQGRVAEAEKLAAHCLEISSNALYPSCAAFLGYNPAAEGVKAKTPEGESAFASAKLASGLKGFLSFGGSGG